MVWVCSDARGKAVASYEDENVMTGNTRNQPFDNASAVENSYGS